MNAKKAKVIADNFNAIVFCDYVMDLVAPKPTPDDEKYNSYFRSRDNSLDEAIRTISRAPSCVKERMDLLEQEIRALIIVALNETKDISQTVLDGED